MDRTAITRNLQQELGRSSLVLMNLRLARNELERSNSEDPPRRRVRCTFNMSNLKRPPIGGVWEVRKGGNHSEKISVANGPRATLQGDVNITLSHSQVVAVPEWYRYRIVAGVVTSSSPVPLKTHRVGQRCTLNLSRAQTSSRWCGVVVRRGGGQFRCHPRHLTIVQNDVVRHPKSSCS
ncbi:uncharacterized protein TNCV_2462681 [Trichonephila clavipes]|nr:uncharacterized protein TNCV_2462681 [Trichonephila clavipes]